MAGTYQYNALGQRVSKTAGTTKELYHYDEAGQLIAVTDESGSPVREYIYNGSQLVSFIATAGTPIPTTTSYIPTAQATLQNATYATTNTGYTAPNGYIQFNGEGQSSWPLTTTATADYTLAFSYALGTATRYMDLYVDGVKKANIKFGTTGSWTVWKTVSTTLNLTTGNHTIILKTTGTSGPNLDRIAVTAVPGQSGGPVATTYYVHSDHQNTPQVVTNQNQQVVFMADYQPFGKVQPGQTNSIELYSRFPGQSVDLETGLYYNMFREYDPGIGRYLTSDPIGLNGGINTYAYVDGNPLKGIDPFGLFNLNCKNCSNGPLINQQVQAACDQVSLIITDPKLASCVQKRCVNATLTVKQCVTPDLLGRNDAFLGIRGSGVKLCENNFPSGSTAFGMIALHEWAHSCGWEHNDGCGVPGDSGYSDPQTGL